MFPRGNGSCLNESLQTLWTTRSYRGKGHCGSVAFLSAYSTRQLAVQHLHELGRTWGLVQRWELLISSTFLLCSLSSKVKFSCRLKEQNLGTFVGAVCLNSHYKQWSQYTHWTLDSSSAYTEVDTLGLFQLPTYRYLMLFERQRILISPMSYLTVSCRCPGFPPASQMALDAFLQAAELSPSQLGSADCNGDDRSGSSPSGAHRDTSI